MARRRVAAAAVAGALLAQVLPFAGPARAAWCWDARPPVCDAPVVQDGSCEEGATIPAGGVCTPQCGGGKVPNGNCLVYCPPSGESGVGTSTSEDEMCIGDLDAIADGNPWWNVCLYYDACAANYPLGDPMWGIFTCVDPADATECDQVDLPTTAAPTCWGSWDCPTAYVLSWYVVMCLIGAAVGRLSVTKARAFFQDIPVGPQMWSPANVAGVLLVLLAPVLYASVLAGDATSTRMPFLTGLAAGLALPLPLSFALFKNGAQSIVNMSTERSWRIHAAFGFASLLFSTAHGAIVLIEVAKPFSKIWWMFGAWGLILMWLGVLAAPLYELFPSVFVYDRFKLLHFASMWGVIFAVLHILEHAVTFGTVRSWLVAIVNLLVLAAYMLQKAHVHWTSRGQAVVAAEVLGPSGGMRYISIRMNAPKFVQAFKPGQWGHLTLNGVTKHPFTCTVSQEPTEVAVLVKVSGSWTARLAAACAGESKPNVWLEGPYGAPCLPDPRLDAAVFVLGGVGVTPALSLAPLAVRCGLRQVHLYWSLREEHLLLHCAPYLEGLAPEHTCVRVTRQRSGSPPSTPTSGLVGEAGIAGGPDELPLAAQYGRADLGAWLQAASAALSGAGCKRTLVFVCGPPPLGAAVRAATAALPEVEWCIHQEVFSFLSPLVAAKPGPHSGVEPSKIGNTS